jgi:cytochrome b561
MAAAVSSESHAEPAVRRYTPAAKAFHWLTVLVMAGGFALAFVMVELPLGTLKVSLYNWHKTLGLVVLALAVLRLAWRLRHPAPPMPAEMPAWERAAAHASHVALYLFLFAQPLLGLVMAWASGFPTVLFGSFNLPNPLGANQGLYDSLSEVHELLAWVLLAVVAVHAGAALRHHFVLKDEVLRRMLPGRAAETPR